jgi:hypothetical protein
MNQSTASHPRLPLPLPPPSVREIYDSILSQPHPCPHETNPQKNTKTKKNTKNQIIFGKLFEYTDADITLKWWIIQMYISAMIEHGIIKYSFSDALADLEYIDSVFKLQCNISMIKFANGTIIFSIRLFTAQKNKKEDAMFETLKRAKYLLLRGSFVIIEMKKSGIKCIKIHPGMIKFENNKYTDNTINPQIALEKVDGINMNIGGVRVSGGIILDVGNKDQFPLIVFIPNKNYVSEMTDAANMLPYNTNASHSPFMAFKILAAAVAKVPKLLKLLTQYTGVFELLNRRMYEIYMGNEFEKLKTPELVILRAYKNGINVPIPPELCAIFRTPKVFAVGSNEYKKELRSMNEGVVCYVNGNPVVKNKTPAFVFFSIVSQWFRKGKFVDVVSQDKFYDEIVELVMNKCHGEGTDPAQAKQFYIDYADMLSLIIYKIACEFQNKNFTVADITNGEDVCNWGNIVSSVIKFYVNTLEPDSPFMKCYNQF